MELTVIVRREKDEEEVCLTLRGLTAYTGLPMTRIRQMVRIGLITPASEEPLLFPAEALRRIAKIERLCGHLDLNLSVMGVVMGLLDRLEALEQEMERLRREKTLP